jgi:hypothetical protein
VDAPCTSFDVRSVPGLLAYFDADDLSSMWQNVGMTTPVSDINGQPIAVWKDRSGNGYDATVLGGLNANRAMYRTAPNGVNGYPAVDFVAATTGGNCMLLNASFRKDLTAITVLATGIIYETNPNLVAMSVAKNGTNPWQGTDGCVLQLQGASTALDLEASSAQANPLDATLTIDNVNPHSFVFLVDAATPGSGTRTGTLYVDGGNAATDTGTSSSPTLALDGFSFGDFYPSGGIPCRWKARQIAAYGRRLSLDELTSVMRYLAARTGLTVAAAK